MVSFMKSIYIGDLTKSNYIYVMLQYYPDECMEYFYISKFMSNV